MMNQPSQLDLATSQPLYQQHVTTIISFSSLHNYYSPEISANIGTSVSVCLSVRLLVRHSSDVIEVSLPEPQSIGVRETYRLRAQVRGWQLYCISLPER